LASSRTQYRDPSGPKVSSHFLYWAITASRFLNSSARAGIFWKKPTDRARRTSPTIFFIYPPSSKNSAQSLTQTLCHSRRALASLSTVDAGGRPLIFLSQPGNPCSVSKRSTRFQNNCSLVRLRTILAFMNSECLANRHRSVCFRCGMFE